MRSLIIRLRGRTPPPASPARTAGTIANQDDPLPEMAGTIADQHDPPPEMAGTIADQHDPPPEMTATVSTTACIGPAIAHLPQTKITSRATRRQEYDSLSDNANVPQQRAQPPPGKTGRVKDTSDRSFRPGRSMRRIPPQRGSADQPVFRGADDRSSSWREHSRCSLLTRCAGQRYRR
jgi:hypothetical protein